MAAGQRSSEILAAAPEQGSTKGELERCGQGQQARRGPRGPDTVGCHFYPRKARK